MILDHALVMSDAQAITNATATSTYYIDTLAAGDAVLPGAFIEVLVDTAFTTSDSGTLTITLDTATSTDLSTGKVTLVTLGTTVAAATLEAKKVYRAPIPEGCLRYLFMTYTLANNMTAGKIDARVVLQGDKTLDKTL